MQAVAQSRTTPKPGFLLQFSIAYTVRRSTPIASDKRWQDNPDATLAKRNRLARVVCHWLASLTRLIGCNAISFAHWATNRSGFRVCGNVASAVTVRAVRRVGLHLKSAAIAIQ